MSKILDEKVKRLSSEQQNMLKLRHTAEHVLHTAMQNLYPDLKKAMGPATDEGFYFDFDLDEKISDKEFPKIESEMKRLIAANLKMVQEFIAEEEARKIFKNNPYKMDWIDQIGNRGEKISIYKMMDGKGKVYDLDLCSGPHVDWVNKIKTFKLLKIAGAYWHGDEKNKMLTRIYGAIFHNKEELEKYLWQQAEAKKRDHRKLGQELDLFTFSNLVGSGLPLWTQKGALIRKLLNDFVENIQSKQGYSQVWTPQITKADLFKISGHYDKYKENLFMVKSNYSKEEFFLKPMNCPQHTQIYASQPRSYRDLPIRMTDFAMLYRDEKPGELNGLARVRSFSQDDCHVFCREDQVDEEVDRALAMTKQIMSAFGFKYRYRLSTRDPDHPEKFIGEPKIWDKVEKWAVKIMKRNRIEYFDGRGEAAFYAPKMDLLATDSLGREWQLSTVQIDYFMPEKFNLTYIDRDGKEKRPIMIHRAIIGSAERMIMVLLEHYAGKLPVWLSPVQVMIVPISEKHNAAADKAAEQLRKADFRVEVNDKNEPMGAKIRNATLQKVPFLGIIGDKEINRSDKDNSYLSVRTREGKDLGQMEIGAFIGLINKQIEKIH